MPEHEFQYPEVNEIPRTHEEMRSEIEKGGEAPSSDELAARRLLNQERRAEERRLELLSQMSPEERADAEAKLSNQDRRNVA